jgi:hypothetical protein
LPSRCRPTTPTRDEDVKQFFGAGQAVLDAGIAAWEAKRAWDSVRPITAIGVEGFTSPVQDQTFSWTSLPQAADSAGLSRRYGGIHFEQGDLAGRQLGRRVGGLVLARCRALFEGRNVF